MINRPITHTYAIIFSKCHPKSNTRFDSTLTGLVIGFVTVNA